MDFESLIGPSAYFAKQLQLRWFYQWEETKNDSSSSSNGDSAAAAPNGNAKNTNDAKQPPPQPSSSTRSSAGRSSGRRNNGSHDDNGWKKKKQGGGNGSGRLVRKSIHSMPFLRRNVIVNSNNNNDNNNKIRNNKTAGWMRRGRKVNRCIDQVLHGKGIKVDPLDIVATEPVSPTAVAAAAVAPNPTRHKNNDNGKRAGEAEASNRPGGKSHKRIKSTNKAESSTSTTANATANRVKLDNNNNNNNNKSSSPTEEEEEEGFQSYIQSPSVHWKILEKIPPELHHDEEFILERLRGSWLEKKKLKLSTTTTKSSSATAKEESEVVDLTSSQENESKGQQLVTKGNTTSYAKSESSPSSESSADTINSTESLETNAAKEAAFKTLSSDAVFPATKKSAPHSAKKQKSKRLPPARFHYVYMQRCDNAPATFVEELEGRRCPLCGFDGKTDEGLLRHCGMVHGALSEANAGGGASVGVSGDGGGDCAHFEAALGEEGQFHVIVRGIPKRPSMASANNNFPNHLEDFQFMHPRLSKPNHRKILSTSTTTNHPNNDNAKPQSSIPFLQRQHRKTSFLDPPVRNKKLFSLQSANAPAPIISAYLPGQSQIPIRQYFHARTNLPMLAGDWDVDSDGEPDEEWRHEMGSELLDEFEDVGWKEKRFMKLWNSFVKGHVVIADRDVGRKCCEFIGRCGRELKEGGLRLNLLLHLFNLWDSGVISSRRISFCMEMLDGVGEGKDVGAGDDDVVGGVLLGGLVA